MLPFPPSGIELAPPDHQSDRHLTEPPRPAIHDILNHTLFPNDWSFINQPQVTKESELYCNCPCDYHWPIKLIQANTKSRKQLFIAALFLSLWRQSAVQRELSGLGLVLGQWQTVQTQIRCCSMLLLIRVYCGICSGSALFTYRQLRVKWNSPKSIFKTIFPAYTQGKLTNWPTSAISALICFWASFFFFFTKLS